MYLTKDTRCIYYYPNETKKFTTGSLNSKSGKNAEEPKLKNTKQAGMPTRRKRE